MRFMCNYIDMFLGIDPDQVLIIIGVNISTLLQSLCVYMLLTLRTDFGMW
jgi:hypothetical protein